MAPVWLHLLAIAMLAIGIAVSIFIAFDEFRQPQHMWIMNVVWPITALYAGPCALWVYVKYGRLATRRMAMPAMQKGAPPQGKKLTPFHIVVATGTAHCGGGCTIADIIVESLAFSFPTVAVWFGWHSIFGEKMFAVWVPDFVLAFIFGIAFQYYTIAPMRNLSFWPGLIAALKADTLSLTAWQIGMYGFMALAQFYFFRNLISASLEANTPEFWFMMQIAMLCGFVTSYPVNWWLIKAKIKEAM